MKRFFVLFLCLIMVACALPLSATCAESDIPKLTVLGDRWPCSEAELQEAWQKYYPYMVKYLGLPSEEFISKGLTWNMTDETLAERTNETDPNTNTVDMGIPGTDRDLTDCIRGLIHETGHLWLQQNDGAINYNFGQWIWEASTNIVEQGMISIDGILYYGTSPYSFDLLNSAGWEYINGTVNDGDKHCRRISDLSASIALFYLDTVLSSEGTFDYIPKVNELRKAAAPNCDNQVSAEMFSEMLDEAAEGKLIDGMKPSEWLFSRAVANTAGSDGTFLYAYANLNECIDGNNRAGHDTRINLMAWTRKDGKETGLAGQNVGVQLFDCNGKLMGEESLVFEDDGSIEKRGVGNAPLDSFAPYSAIRYVSSMTVDGTEYKDTCFSLVFPDGEFIKNDDDRIFFILTDDTKNIVTDLNASELTIDGVTSTELSYLANGLLIVTAERGQNVTIVSPLGSTVFSKPLGSRIIPLMVRATNGIQD